MLNDKEEGSGASGMADFSNMGLIKNSRNIQDEIGILRSLDLMEQVVKELNLDIGFYVEGRFSEIQLYGDQVPFKVIVNDSLPIKNYGTLGQVFIVDEYSYRIEKYNQNEDSVTKSVHDFGENVSTKFGDFKLDLITNDIKGISPITVRFRDPVGIAMSYNTRLEAYPVNSNGSGLLQLGLTDAIAERGLDVINKLIEVYAQNSADSKNFLSNATLKLIDERLALLTEDLNAAEKDVETFKQSNDLTNVESDATRFIALADETERALSEVRNQINAINTLERSLSISSGDFSPISAFNIQDPILTNAILAYNTEVQRRISIVNSTGIGNPMLPEIDSNLRQTKSLIAQNANSIKIQLTRTQKELLNKLSQYRSRKASVPSAERALLEINRDQGIKNGLYLFLLQKREEEALSISVPFSDIRIIEAPKATSYPVNGGKTPIYVGAFLLGLFIPFSYVFVKDVINTKILEQKDIESKTEAPILGRISENNTDKTLVVSAENVTPIVELFRLLRYNLRFLSKNKEQSVIMVTSGKQGEGKTFIAINTAASLALSGKKVVVLGFDLRVPKLMKDVNLNYKTGLSDYIVDDSVIIENMVISHPEQKNLHFIGSGTIPPNPGELMLSERVELLIKQLKTVYDFIIIDTPPIGKVADAFSLAPYVDTTLFVVRHNYTKKEELQLVNEIISGKKLESLLIVYNGVKLDGASSSYSYGYGAKT